MRHTVKNIILLIAANCGLFLLLLSCEKDMVIDMPKHTPSLVVHAYTAIGDTFVVAIGKTTNSVIVGVDTETYVTNATAVLYEDGVLMGTLNYDPLQYRYTSSVDAKPGKTYRITVQAPGFASVEATALAPFPSSTTVLSFIKNARADMDGQPLTDVTFRITDPANQKNFYLTELGSEYTSTFCVYTYDAAVEQYQGTLNPFETGNCISNDQVLIKDDLFNGTSRTITVSGSAWALEDFVDFNRVRRPYLKEYNISEEYYEYIKDGISVDILEGNPFAEPHIIGGNVKNGYGLFTVFSVTVDTLR